ncbi:dihydrofolate reductase family protein [Aeromicrobium sp. Leaf350]|uniref:dihydrofolate reductase family protein n=1 Tax=Aeromicrobium sp. Leaf350 TaxID=2876565 RepID=UPI001E58698C|nr:dihydrofolate reductase family protein [Aeromicrobium sp. Leaf350]
MRELTYFVAVSLDGFISGPDHDFSAFPVTGDHIEMIFREYPDTLPKVGLDAMGLTATGDRFDTTLMGWKTYEVGFEATRDPYPHTRQVVFSRSHTQAEAPPNIVVTDEDPVAVVRRLKAEPGNGIWLCGGGDLAGQLVDEIDRLVLKVNPIVLGGGTPLFSGVTSARTWTRAESTPYDSGVVVNEYVPAATAG